MDDLQTIERGTDANDGTGDTSRDAALKINENFTEVQTEIESRLRFVTGSTTWTPSTVADAGFDFIEFTVTGAVLGQQALACIGADLPEGAFLTANVVEDDVVRVTLFNFSGGSISLGNQNLRVDCLLP